MHLLRSLKKRCVINFILFSFKNCAKYFFIFWCFVQDTCFFLCFYHFTYKTSISFMLATYKFPLYLLHDIQYKFYNRLQLEMYNSQFGFFLKIHQVRANSWTITKFRDLCKPISACFFEIVI